jgi:cellulose biosynthesis protein BcsQ
VIGAFHEVIRKAARIREADIALIDVGPNLGAINRAALIAAERVVVPLGPDLFSLKGLQNLGPTLREWRRGWRRRLEESPADIDLPAGEMQPAGYVIMQHSVRLDRPVKAFEKWISRIPGTYREAVLAAETDSDLDAKNDPNCLATLKDYRSLMPMAQEARKPMFHLKPADGAIGSHVHAVVQCYWDFKNLAGTIARRCGVEL